MSSQIARGRLKPEEEEVIRKRAELAAIRATLAERELELTDVRSQLAAFEGRYLRQVGILYAELDEWKARLLLFQARRDSSAGAQQRAEEAQEQARRTHEAAHGEASRTHDFTPSPELKRLFREVAKRIHPDLALDAADQERRTQFMAEANGAYQAGDAETLECILNEFHEGSDADLGEGIGAALIRIIRQMSRAKERISTIERDLAVLLQSEIAHLKQSADEAQQQSRDLLAELATAVRERIQRAEREYEILSQEVTSR